MKNIFKLLLVSLIFTACEDVEPTIYNGSAENPTFLSFNSSSLDFPVPRDIGGTYTLVLNSSTVSSVDRVYTLDVNEDLSSADEAIYDFPSEIVIPAGSYQGTALVQGYDVNLDATAQTVVFSISNLQDEDMDDTQITLNLFEVCPLEAPFTGEYTVQQIGSGLNIDVFGKDGEPAVVTLEMGNNEYERTITDFVYQDAIAAISATFRFTITCDGVMLRGRTDTGIQCVENGPTLQFKAAPVLAPVDHSDDSTIAIRLTENSSSACGGAPTQITLILNKVVD